MLKSVVCCTSAFLSSSTHIRSVIYVYLTMFQSCFPKHIGSVERGSLPASEWFWSHGYKGRSQKKSRTCCGTNCWIEDKVRTKQFLKHYAPAVWFDGGGGYKISAEFLALLLNHTADPLQHKRDEVCMAVKRTFPRDSGAEVENAFCFHDPATMTYLIGVKWDNQIPIEEYHVYPLHQVEPAPLKETADTGIQPLFPLRKVQTFAGESFGVIRRAFQRVSSSGTKSSVIPQHVLSADSSRRPSTVFLENPPHLPVNHKTFPDIDISEQSGQPAPENTQEDPTEEKLMSMIRNLQTKDNKEK